MSISCFRTATTSTLHVLRRSCKCNPDARFSLHLRLLCNGSARYTNVAIGLPYRCSIHADVPPPASSIAIRSKRSGMYSLALLCACIAQGIDRLDSQPIISFMCCMQSIFAHSGGSRAYGYPLLEETLTTVAVWNLHLASHPDNRNC